MKLQTSTRLGVYAVLDLAAEPDRWLSVAEIAERHHASVNHLSKVMQLLSRAGLVEGTRGVGGGYRFRANAKRLTLLQVIELFEDPTGGGPEEARGSGDAREGIVDQVLGEIDVIARLTLDSMSISTMLRLAADRARRSTSPEARTPSSPAPSPSSAG